MHRIVGKSCKVETYAWRRKKRETDLTYNISLLRLMQSLPYPESKLFKLWLAKAGYERKQEIQDTEMSPEKSRENW